MSVNIPSPHVSVNTTQIMNTEQQVHTNKSNDTDAQEQREYKNPSHKTDTYKPNMAQN